MKRLVVPRTSATAHPIGQDNDGKGKEPWEGTRPWEGTGQIIGVNM